MSETIQATMVCDWCGKVFPADARACCEGGFVAMEPPSPGDEWKGDAPVSGVSPEEFTPDQLAAMKTAMGLDDTQLAELLRTGSVEGLGLIVCLECQDKSLAESEEPTND